MKCLINNLLLAACLCIAGSSYSQSWTTNGSSAICKTNGNNVRITVKRNGEVWIGDTSGTQKSSSTFLYVDGKVRAREILVDLNNWPDFVFDSTYSLMPLDSVELFIDSANHLPNVPSQQEIVSQGLPVGAMNAILMQKLEELQLYIIQLNARIKELEATRK